MKSFTINTDSVGIFAGALCMIHCIATPFIFIVKACSSSCCADAPLWWTIIDYFFILISFIAIYFSTKNSSVKWIKFALWISWGILLITILNHSLLIFNVNKYFIYFPASSIILLHFYNIKYCQCKDTKCCIK